ncbi:unnamed protein product [Phytomonas sp. EM1]|nr:unnamed protein product [Phytomonas sp. EM1]|eukprot:CCW62593.1 unnamed protein product [Phytomonas sp. isolate EM1]
MGNSASAVNAFDSFRSALSNDSFRMEDAESVFNLSFTKKDLTRVLSNEFIRELRHFHTERFALLFYCCIKEISSMREGKKSSVSSFKAEEVCRFLTALQILRRLLPIAFEDGATEIDKDANRQSATTTSIPSQKGGASEVALSHSGNCEPSTLEEDQEYVSSQSSEPISSGANSCSQQQNRMKTRSTFHFQKLFFIEGSKCNDSETDSRFPLLPLQEAHEAPKTLGPYLAWVLVESCFIQGLTLLKETNFTNTPLYSLVHSEVDVSLLWYPGIGCANPSEAPLASTPSEVHTARRELLETLLVLVSSPLFFPVGYRDTIFTESLISISVVPLMPTLAVSMLNSILTYKPHSHFPYATKLSIDEREVVIISSRFLSAILYYSGIPIDTLPNESSDRLSTKKDEVLASRPLTDAKEFEEHNRSHFVSTNSQPNAQVADKVQEDTLVLSLSGKQDNISESGGLGKLVLHSPVASSTSSEHMPPHHPPDGTPPIARNEPISNNSQRRSSRDDTVGNVSQSIVRICFVHSIRKVVHDLTMSEAKLILDRLKNTVVPSLHARQIVLPSSRLATIPQDGLMFLLSKLLDISPSVSSQFSLNPGVIPYLVPIVEYGMQAYKSTYYSGQAQISLNILLHLSQNRGFTLLCNQTLSMSTSMPVPFPKMPSGSTFNDFLVTALSFFMGFLETSLGPHLISCSTVLANMAPFIISLGKIASKCLVAAFAYVAHQCLEYKAANSSEKLVIYETAMTATCEAISCLFRYHEEGSRYVIASLLSYRNLIGRVREAYIKSRPLRDSIYMPFMIQDLVTVVAAAIPIVDSLAFFSQSNDSSDGEQAYSDFNAFWNHTERIFEDDKVLIRKLSTLVLVGMLLPHQITIKVVPTTKQTEEQKLALFWGSMFICFDPGSLGDFKSIKLLRFA